MIKKRRKNMEGIKVYWEIPVLGGLPITETMVNTWIVMIVIISLSLYLTKDMKKYQKGNKYLRKTCVILL